jgi:hypothetical protein
MNTQAFKNPDDQQSGPNCGVTALAVSAGVSFRKAWQTFQAVNPYRYGKRWKGGVLQSDIEAALARLKVAAEKLPRKKMNLKRFVKEHTRPNTLYLVTTGRHAQTVLNGEVIDQSGKKPIDDFWGRRKFVDRAIMIKEPFKHADSVTDAPLPARPQGHTSSARQLMLF